MVYKIIHTVYLYQPIKIKKTNPKFLSQRMRILVFKTLDTIIIFSPMSPSSPEFIPNFHYVSV